MSDISHTRIFIRCLMERKGTQWQAFSLEFGLAAQGDSYNEVYQKLELMAAWYVHDSLFDQDKEHAYKLMRRRARWQIFARYYIARMFHNRLDTITRIMSLCAPCLTRLPFGSYDCAAESNRFR